MADLPFNPDEIDVPAALSLVVAWKRGRGLAGGEVPAAGNVRAHLRAACADTLDLVVQKDARDYDPDMYLENEECLVASADHGMDESPVLDLVFPEEPLPRLSAQDLPKRPLLFYAVTFETDEGPIAFLRKTNPQPGAKPGRIPALLGDSLTRITDPVFFLDDFFDLVIYDNTVVALRQSMFETLFRDTEALQARIPDWVSAITDHLPIAGDGAARLAERCATDSRLRRRLHSIVDRGHLADIGIAEVRAHISELELDETDFVQNDELVIDDQDPFKLMHLLNEDLFRGGLTQQGFVSDRKSLRS